VKDYFDVENPAAVSANLHYYVKGYFDVENPAAVSANLRC
jgi:hypothetical protein